jgi:hypothetical protein
MQSIKKASLVIFFGIGMFTSHAQSDLAPKYSNEFLQIGVGARALGMSNAIAAGVDDVTAAYWNPAGLTDIRSWMQGALMHSEYFAGIAKYDYLGLAYPIDDRSTFAFSAIRFAVDDIPNTTQLIDNQGNIDYDRITRFTAADYAFLLSYARKMKLEGMSAGGSFKVIYRKVGDFAHSWGFGLDAGLKYAYKKNWKFGIVMRDVTSTFNAWVFTLDDKTKEVFQMTGNQIPENGLELTLPRFIFAAQGKFDIGKGFYGLSEIDMVMTTDGRRNTLLQTNGVSFDPYMGVEVGFKNIVAVRCGFGNFQYIKNFDDSRSLTFQPNIGLGVHFKGVHIDYAFTDIGDQSVALYSHVISLKLDVKKPKGKPKSTPST